MEFDANERITVHQYEEVLWKDKTKRFAKKEVKRLCDSKRNDGNNSKSKKKA